MLTREDMILTVKYMNDYSRYCAERQCGEGCPVYDKFQKISSDPNTAKTSCFKIYCRLREDGVLDAPKGDILHSPYREDEPACSN